MRSSVFTFSILVVIMMIRNSVSAAARRPLLLVRDPSNTHPGGLAATRQVRRRRAPAPAGTRSQLQQITPSTSVSDEPSTGELVAKQVHQNKRIENAA